MSDQIEPPFDSRCEWCGTTENVAPRDMSLPGNVRAEYVNLCRQCWLPGEP